MQGGIKLCKQIFARVGGTLNKTPLKKVKKMNIIIFALVGISIFSLTTFTSYALFTNEAEGSNSISLTVSTAGRISIRIFEQNTGTEDVTLANHQNVIKFNVKDGLVMDSFSCTTGEATYNKLTNILTINNATQNGTCDINYVGGYRKLYDIILNQSFAGNNGLLVTYNTDDGSPSYYYRGRFYNNYVSFAGLTWRIVRINENGSIRLILNSGINSNEKVAYNSNSSDYTHSYYSNTATSGIKHTVDTWYNNTIATNSNYSSKVVDSKFCQKAKVKSDDSYTFGSLTIPTAEHYSPSLKCAVGGDGMGPLTYKAGLLSADEVIMAGVSLYDSIDGWDGSYLNIGQPWWIIGPSGFNSGYGYAYGMVFNNSPLKISIARIHATYAVRPVISLNKDVLVSGNGSSTDPFVVR